MAWISGLHWTAWCGLITVLWAGDAAAQVFDSYGLSYAFRTELSEDTILVANNGLRVPFGRSVFIDPINHLVIQVQPRDRCSITVLDKDPLSQRPGELSPKKFPCEFGPNDVKYSHFGSRSPSRDRVRLQLRYDTQIDTIIIPFMIEVEVVFTQLEVLTKNLPLTVERLLGTSNPIDKRILEFTFDRATQQCKIVSLSSGSVLPRYGKLEEKDSLGSMVNCDDFINKNVRYQHTFALKSPNRDYIPMLLELYDKEGNLLKQESFQILVRIKEGQDNTAPKPSFVAMMIMEVDQFVMTAITMDMLAAEDKESNPDELIFNITSPLSFEEGYIVSTDDRNLPINSFYQGDLKALKIAYKPSAVDSDAERIFQIEFEVVDTEGAPVDNKPPQITNSGFTLLERGTHIISSAELYTTDTDTDSKEILFTITQPPTHGHIQYTFMDMTKGDTFILDDIETGKISYTHNGDESTADSIILDVSDGVHVVPITIKIYAKPIDDEVPTIALPPGTIGSTMEVLENGATEITNNVIQGQDEDTDDLRLTFIVEDPPLLGQILVRGVAASKFTQADIINGFVVYAHTSGEIGIMTKEDYFNLTLTDMSDEWTVGGNKITGVRVHVTILPLDSQAPEVFVVERYSVIEGEKSPIESIHIQANDVDTLIDDLLCTIIVQPTSGYVENISPAPGSERSRSGTAISAFTIKDIKRSHIYYVQSIHKGVEPVEDRFTFRCSDGINFSERRFFSISIIPSNDEKPEIYMREFVVMEGMNVVIDTPILNGADADFPLDQLTFIVSKPPKHGFILNQLTTGTVPVFNFTLDKIKEASSILYEHDNSETIEDSFDVILTDGKFSIEKTVIVMVIPVDDETPRMAINNGLEIEIGGVKVITNNALKATDLDSEDGTLIYVIRYGPGQGYLQTTTPYGTFQNLSVGMNFTQNDIDLGTIVYIHNGQEGIRDLIKFDVTDGINPLIDRYFYVTVGGIDMVFPDVVSKGVSLKEGSRVTLTTDLLSTTDLNSPDEHLVFTITRAPMRGHLECTDKPGLPISSFTQLQLAGNKVYYIHTADDEVKMDSFEFEVTDGYNPVFRTFRISVTDVDNKKPVVTVHGLVVTEGANKLITPFELTIEDGDTSDRLLKFTVTQVPVHGKLLFNNTRSVNTFTKQDLNENMISYKHDGTESVEDSFSFTQQVMKITVLPVDNGVPQIVVNKGATTLKVLESRHLGFVFTSKTLKVEDRDSLQNAVIFQKCQPPKHI
uniref:FRAS1-related extracellular matrix protein N-terminal domain-containing protein n=1 Tax=Periophthalmus magnuspinnatus TaxID=409849 RepID=A0A3B4BHL2_9GOBI